MSARMRLIVAALLFAGWIGWIGYLALTTTRPIVLSRPQFLMSEFDVVAQLRGDAKHPEPNIVIDEVLWSTNAAAKPASEKLDVVNLPLLTKDDGWQGAGVYIVPLVKEDSDYRVPAIPLSPGFSERQSRPRIYLRTPETIEQVRQIRAAFVR